MSLKKLFFLFYGLFAVLTGKSEVCNDSLPERNRLPVNLTLAATGVAYAGSMAALYQTWYREYAFGGFNTFNDWNEWRGMDKAGHFATAWWASGCIVSALSAAGATPREQLVYGAGIPLAFLTTIEVFDGFSEGWGFSWGDMTANLAGSGFWLLQQRLWKEQKITVKFSWHQNNFARIRPSLLGRNRAETWLKNYNGQTYWLSIPLKDIFFRSREHFPAWLCFSLGYGADGMLGARTNRWTDTNGLIADYSAIDRYSQLYCSFDIDLARLPLKGKAWKIVTSAFRWVKIPFPALEWNPVQGTRFHPLYR